MSMANTIFSISNFRRAVFFLLGDPPASEFYVQTFRNTMFHIHSWCRQEGLTPCSETSAYNIRAPGNHPNERIQQTQYCLTYLVRNKCFCMISYLVFTTMYQLLSLYNDEWGTNRIVLARRKYLSVREHLHARRIWLYNNKECDFTVHKWQSRDMLQREKAK
jgi:hypothetical protein